MEIIGKKIKLRPFKESDADNVINWILVETVWQNWDAPREESSDFVQRYLQGKMFERTRQKHGFCLLATLCKIVSRKCIHKLGQEIILY